MDNGTQIDPHPANNSLFKKTRSFNFTIANMSLTLSVLLQ